MIKIVIDTDAGTDVDDLFALTYLLKNPYADVKAISATQGNTRIRAKIIRKLERMLEVNVPIIAGQSGPEESIKKYWTGIEELALTEKEKQEEFKSADYPVYTPETKLICIGPLTNIALQLQTNQSIGNVKEVYVMGFIDTSHNFKADLEAKSKVFEQPWNIYQIRKEESKQISFDVAELKKLRGNPLGNFLSDSALRWLDYVAKGWIDHDPTLKSSMYDVLVVSAALGEPYVRFQQTAENRFVSCEVDPTLKEKIVEAIEK